MAEKEGAGAKKDATVNVANSLSSRLNNPASFGMPGRRRAQKGRSLKPRMGKSSSAPAIGVGGNKFGRKNITFKKNTKVNNFLNAGGKTEKESKDATIVVEEDATPPPPSPSTLDQIEKTKLLLEIKNLNSSRTDSSKGAGGKQQPQAISPLARKHRRIPTFTESLNLDRAALTEFLNGNFLYMRPTKDAQSVYDLGVVDHSEVNMDDYHTMSRAGITHFTLSSEPEFTPLDVWEREYHLFNVIQFIPFFRKYRLWKSYTTWKKTVRGGKMGNASTQLTNKLFLLTKQLREAMAQVRHLCFKVGVLGLFDLGNDEPLPKSEEELAAEAEEQAKLAEEAAEKAKQGASADMFLMPSKETEDEANAINKGIFLFNDFLEAQRKKRELLGDWLLDFTDDIRMIVRGACDSVLDDFLEGNNIVADHKMTFMEKAALRTACRKLVKFVRLCDFIVQQTLLDLGVESTHNLLEWLQPNADMRSTRVKEPKKKKKKKKARKVVDYDEQGHGIYEDGTTTEDEREEEEKQKAYEAELEAQGAHPCEVRLMISASMIDPENNNSALELKPNSDTVVDEIMECITEAVAVLGIPESIMEHDDLAPYVQGANEETDDGDEGDDKAQGGVSLDQQVMWNPHFQKCSKGIKACLLTNYGALEDYLGVFAPYLSIFDANEEHIGGDIAETYANINLDEMETEIEKYRGQNDNFQRIPRLTDVGAMRLDTIQLRFLLLPSPIRCLEAMEDLLPVLIRNTSEKTMNEAVEKEKILSTESVSCAEFITSTRYLQKCEKEQETLEAQRDRVMRMTSLMQSQRWAVPDDILAHNKMLNASMEALKSQIDISLDQQDSLNEKWVEWMNKAIPDLRGDIANMGDLLRNPIIADPDHNMAAVIEYIGEQEDEIEVLKKRAADFQDWQGELKVTVEEYDDLDEVIMDCTIKLKMWEGLRDFGQMTDNWKGSPMMDLEIADIEKQVAIYMKTAGGASRALPDNPVAPKLRAIVDEFKKVVPVVQSLRNPALKERHWEEIEGALNHKFSEDDPPLKYTLGAMIDLGVVEKVELIEQASVKAIQEKVLKDMFAEKILTVWKHLEFEVMNYKDRNDTFIVGGIDPITEALDDSLVTLNTILGSRFCAPIRFEVTRWQKKLVLLSDTLDEWLQCQRQWMYLETIFSAADIQRQLPGESKRFFEVDKSFRQIMQATYDVPKAITAGTVQGRKSKLAKHNTTLDRIQKSLEDYLETKRQAFPRFYFLSNDELLEILAQVRDPHAVQPHLRKCFDCIQKLEFGDKPGSVDIVAMISPEGERVPLGKNLKARGNVEEWLMAVQNRMQKVLHERLKEATLDYDTKGRSEWILEGGHPGQCVATAAQIQWCAGSERTLKQADVTQGGMDAWVKKNNGFVMDLVMMVRGKIPRLTRKILVALITTDVYATDVLSQLRDQGVNTVKNFAWEQQLRYYWDAEEDDCLIRHANACLRYCYEYMGCTGRLVITPLTAKCWITITGAIHLKLGAAPAGPAGTGKTESSKDLAKAMGTFCVVFNCSDQIDYIMLGKLFAGLAQCGCWTCLDEFNRINIEVLSVVAQQLLTLREGMKSGKARIDFEGRNIQLLSHCVIVTMNPGYAGRTALPDNLKVCFRPVAMMVPNYALIAEIILYAQGFEDARGLSRKMAKLYILASEQLSQQPHYDYGLRAVISVLLMAGGNKRSNPDLSEDVVLIKSMRDSNLPKFLAEDVPLFRAILVDLFPGVDVPLDDYGDLLVAINDELLANGFQQDEKLIAKIIQLHDMLAIRFGVTIVGPTCGGKTVAWKVMTGAHSRLREAEHENLHFQISRIDVINPKCITMGELYGEFNELTQEWTDGLGSTIVRRQVREVTDDKLYIMFDGPIDTLWIESLNTVLDDNRMLCLANGERIRLKNLDQGPGEMRMLFEVEDLAEASPATVSRLGVVYLTPGDIGWRPFVVSWLQRELGPETLNPELSQSLLTLFDSTIDAGLDFRRRNCKEPIVTTPCQQATSVCNLFLSLFARSGINKETEPNKNTKELVKKLFAFSYIWGMGGSIRADDSEKFGDFCEEILDGVNFGRAGVYGSYVHTPQEGCSEEAGAFRKWEEIVLPFTYDKTMPYVSLVVPTLDTTRYGFMMQAYYEAMKPIFFTGVTGTGKSVIASDLLQRLSVPPEGGGNSVLPIPITFSGQTSAKLVQLTIEAKFEKKRKDLLGPPVGKNIVIFIDDVNMPSKEEYGAQPPIELLRQTLDHALFYDREKLFLKYLEGQVLFCAAAPPGGGRADITQRFTRHFHIFCLPPASGAVLSSIFVQILENFLEANKFDEEIGQLAPKFVDCTIKAFESICEDLRPTPAKSHYTFNLRDVSKVFQGCLMVRAKEVSSAKDFCKLWVHEVSRVFQDRLVNETDTKYFSKLISGLVGRGFTFGFSEEDLFYNAQLPILYSDFLRPSMDDGPGIYEIVKDRAKLERVLYNNLEDYNLSNPTQMKLVFFMDAIKHICRCCRMLRQPRGNVMLVGVGGSGKQSVTKMACHMSEVTFYQIEMIRGYNHMSFLENLKEIMLVAGVEGKRIAFCLIDTQIVDESFLEDVNNILNTGEVPNLFLPEEYNKICEDIRPAVKHLGLETRDELQKAFVDRVRANLHIVLCHSPVGNALRVRCREFPSLINCTTIDWYTKWPKEALTSVARQFLQDEDLHTDDIKAAMCDMCAELHWTVGVFGDKFFNQLRRKTYTTPKSFLDMIELYRVMLKEKRGELGTSQKRLSVGVTKLEETNAVVEGLQVELTALQPVLKEKAEAAAKMIIVVERDQKEADIVKAKVEKVVEVVSKQAAETKVIADDAQADLDEAMPAFNNALKALDSLSKDDITEIKNFAKPPEMVQVVMEAVCILLGRDTDWKSAKALLQESNFMDQLKNYDKDNIPKKRIKKINGKKYVKNPKFTVEAIAKVSTAAKSLCMWIHAMAIYDRVAKTVEPKKKLLAKMNAELDKANANLKGKQDELDAILAKVADLKATLEATLAEKKQLEDDTALTQGRLQRAEKLTVGLADEHVRWQETVATLDEKILNLIGDVFISAACISYYGPFTGTYRSEMVSDWVSNCVELKIPTSAGCNLREVLEDPVVTREWQLDGLPSDEVSTNNAIMVTRGKRWPLLIDPQEQGKKWISKMELKNKLCTSRLTDKNMLRDLENCIRIGRPLLIEDIGEQLDPALEPILQRATFKQGGRLLIRLGDSDVDYDPNFTFYLTTKLPNPHYLPEVCIKVTVINFTVTMSGLVDQLLGDVVGKERPDVEERMVKLVMSIAEDKKQMLDIETKILKSLSESEGNILDDVELIRTLDDSKVVSAMIKQRLEESVRTKAEIDEIRASYMSASTRASLIYFIVADLAQVDPMYQFSLAYFKRLFHICIDDSEKSDDLETRLKNIINYSTEVIYVNICRGLFEKDKLTFSFLVCCAILRNAGEVSSSEWSLLLRGAGLTENPLPNPEPEKIKDAGWNLLHVLQEEIPDKFGGIVAEFGEDGEDRLEWLEWIACDAPQRTPLPSQFWNDRLNLMQKMLLIKGLREEKGASAVADFVDKKMGRIFVQAPPVKLEEVYKDSNNRSAVVFILSTGADPTGLLLTLARKMNYSDRLNLISMGQGQGPKALNMVANGKKTGDWVLLQNCHLAKSWMPTLESLVDGLGEETLEDGTPNRIHEDFRLWLTSMPATYFPIPILQNGVKMTNEPPRGLRANMMRSLTMLPTWTDFETCTGRIENVLSVWKRLAYSTCFFHAMVQERRRFGALGWNIVYEFNDSDLEAALLLLKMFLEEQPAIPYDALQYMTAVNGYGGRVTDFLDERCIETILTLFYNDEAALNPAYAVDTRSEKKIYFIPSGDKSLADFITHTEALPLTDGPEVFGLHMNAIITVEFNETRNILGTSLMLQPRDTGSGGGGKSPDETVTEITISIQERLPDVMTEDEAGPKAFVMRGEYLDSLSTALKQEMVRYNKIIRKMQVTLRDIQRAIKGEVLMSAELDDQYMATLNNLVPPNWANVAYPSLKPLASWISDLIQRIEFQRKWLHEGQPTVFWFGGFYFPQGFMTGSLQNHARKYKLPIDELKFAFEITNFDEPEEVEEPPTDGVYIHGIYFDGARWNSETGTIYDAKPQTNWAPVPVVHFIPFQNYVPDPAQFSCPVYKTSTRSGALSTTGMSTNYVINIEMPCPEGQPPKKWVLAGVGCVINLND